MRYNTPMDIKHIQETLRAFADERDWDQFHSPKNLAMALSVEVSELLEIFQWLTERQSCDIVNSERDMKDIEQEVADIFIYLLRLSDKLGIDIERAVTEKIAINAAKYPVAKAKGSAKKYNKP